MARTQMRRERVERAERSRIDPITGSSPDDLFSAEDEDGGDLFRRRTPSAQPSSSGLPGNESSAAGMAGSSPTAPGSNDAAASTSPSLDTLFGPPPESPRARGSRGSGNASLSSAARLFPEASGRSTMGGFSPSASGAASRPFERPTAPMSGPITGGVRAGAPAVRPGYGTAGVPNDLNAARLRGGSPADFRGVTLPGALGGTTFRGFVPRGTSTLNAGRPSSAQRPPTLPRPGSTPSDFYGP